MKVAVFDRVRKMLPMKGRKRAESYLFPFFKVVIFWMLLLALILPSNFIFLKVHELGHIKFATNKGIEFEYRPTNLLEYVYQTLFEGRHMEEMFIISEEEFCSLPKDVNMMLRTSGIAAELSLLRYLVMIIFVEFILAMVLASMRERRETFLSYVLKREGMVFSFFMVNAVLLIMITVGVLRLFYYIHYGGGDFFFFCP